MFKFKFLRGASTSLLLVCLSSLSFAANVMAVAPMENPPGAMVGPVFTGVTVYGTGNDVHIAPSGIRSTLSTLGLNLGGSLGNNVVIGSSMKGVVSGLVVGGLTQLKNNVEVGAAEEGQGANLTVFGNVTVENGSSELPAFAFAGSLSTGMYRSASGQLCFSVNGAKAWCVDEINPEGEGSGEGGNGEGTFNGRLHNGTSSAPAFSFTSDTNTGMYRPEADVLAFVTNGAERLRLDGSGFLRTPSVRTTNYGSASIPAFSFNDDNNTGMYRSGDDALSFTTAGSERLRITNLGRIQSVQIGQVHEPAFSFTGDVDTGMYSPGSNELAFSTGSSNRIRIFSNGNVAIGKDSANGKLDVNGTIVATGLNVPGISVSGGSTSTSGNMSVGGNMEMGGNVTTGGNMAVGGNMSTGGNISSNGNMTASGNIRGAKVGVGRDASSNALEVNGQASKTTAGDWVANSDARLKKNIVELSSEEMLDKVLEMRGVAYEWNDNKTGYARPTGKQYGFVAQDVVKVWPNNVVADENGYLQTSYGTYDFMYVEAIKALYGRLHIQTNEMAKMRADNEELRKMVEKLTAELEIVKDEIGMR